MITTLSIIGMFVLGYFLGEWFGWHRRDKIAQNQLMTRDRTKQMEDEELEMICNYIGVPRKTFCGGDTRAIVRLRSLKNLWYSKNSARIPSLEHDILPNL